MNEYTITFGGDFSFSDTGHLENHINYLCRTDTAQKWTNELTAQNCAVIWDEKKEYQSFGSAFDQRCAIADQIRALCKEQGIYDNTETFQNLRMLRGDYLNDKIFRFDLKMLTDIKEIITELSDIDGIKVLCVVTHMDQQNHYVHFHILLLNENNEDSIDLLEKSIGKE